MTVPSLSKTDMFTPAIRYSDEELQQKITTEQVMNALGPMSDEMGHAARQSMETGGLMAALINHPNAANELLQTIDKVGVEAALKLYPPK